MTAKHVHNSTSFTFDHPSLGPMTGLINPNSVVQFRAVPFARIPARFTRSILLDSIAHTDRNFTQPGFACPQVFPIPIHSGGPFPDEPTPHLADENNCLILQVNVPLVCLQSDSEVKIQDLPVLVYIHGGGFVLGKIDEQHSTALLVEQSLLDKQPVITVNIQYRLGALGYLCVPEASKDGTVEWEGNAALYDQRNALLWIQKFIAGFGGNEKNVTVMGESAGGISIGYQMLAPPPPSSPPLFRRAILMSGVIGPMTAPVPIKSGKELYGKFLSELGIQHEGGEHGALKELRNVDVQKIVEASAKLTGKGEMWLPVQDEEWFGSGTDVSWDRIPELLESCEWVDSIVLGVTRFEGSMFLPTLSSATPLAWLESVAAQLGQDSAESISRAYGITPNMDQNLFVTTVIHWAGHVLFDAPTHALARSLSTHTSKKVYRYVFDVRNPFPGHHLYQQAHHWVDKYFVFKTLQFRYPTQRLKEISTRHAQLWIDFANGKEPWRKYDYDVDQSRNSTIMVADERDGWVERSVIEDETLTEESCEKQCEILWENWENAAKGEWLLPFRIKAFDGKKLV